MARKMVPSSDWGIPVNKRSQYDEPFQIIGSFSTRLVLPPAMADWVKTDPRFNAVDVVMQSMVSDLPGFEGLRAPHALKILIRTNLSTNLSKCIYECHNLAVALAVLNITRDR